MSPISAARPRVLVAGLYHETNTFLPDATPLADFEERAGAALLAAEGDGSPLGCALEEARARGWEVVPAIDLRATPSGTVEDAVVHRFRAGLTAVAGEATPVVDGVLLVLHGAMVSASLADVEGAVVAGLRALPGLAEVPVVAVLDLHASVTDAMARHADALVIYRENPHADAGEAGRRAARLLDRLIRSGGRMTTLCARAPVVWPPTGTATAADPMRALEAMARAAEAEHPALLAEVGVVAGFSFADVPEAGVGFTASFPRGNADAERAARATLDRLRAAAWERRAEGNVVGLPLAEVVRRAAAHAAAGAPGGPLVIAEPADNIGAGAPGDRTALLGALLDAGVGGVAAALCDPGAVAELLARARAGETLRRLPIGGKAGGVGSGTLVLDVTLARAVPDGRFRLEDPQSHLASMGGDSFDMGPCAVVRSGGATLLLTSRRTPPFDLGQWRAAGIDPETMAVIVAKAAVAHRRVYDPVAGAHLTAETPGPCASDLTTLPYRNLRRPVYPLDPDAAVEGEES